MLHRQNIADSLKPYIEKTARPDQRRQGMILLKRFEREDIEFDPARFEEALQSFPVIKIEGDTLRIEAGRNAAALAAIGVLQRYLDLRE